MPYFYKKKKMHGCDFSVLKSEVFLAKTQKVVTFS